MWISNKHEAKKLILLDSFAWIQFILLANTILKDSMSNVDIKKSWMTFFNGKEDGACILSTKNTIY